MAANRGRGFSGHGSDGSDRGRGLSHGHGRTSRGRGRSSGGSQPQCQVCLKIGHTVDRCWHRYEEDYVPETRTATSDLGVDQAWYTDSGSTDHITGELDRLTMHDPYTGTDQIHAANGSDMAITRIGTSLIPTSDRDLVLNNVLHVPATHKNLISVHHFTLDNNTFIEFHPYFFFIKDKKTKKVLLHGPCKGGIYPLPPSSSKF
jgi:hypothetical protein